jgi:hypothetical protein
MLLAPATQPAAAQTQQQREAVEVSDGLVPNSSRRAAICVGNPTWCKSRAVPRIGLTSWLKGRNIASRTDRLFQSWSIYSRTTSNVGRDSHFEDGDIREFDAVFLDLGCGAWWTEIPLLAHNLTQCAF